MGNGDDHVVEVVTQEMTRLFKRCESRLQKLGGPGKSTPEVGAVQVESI
jgi:hypothetical protein